MLPCNRFSLSSRQALLGNLLAKFIQERFATAPVPHVLERHLFRCHFDHGHSPERRLQRFPDTTTAKTHTKITTLTIKRGRQAGKSGRLEHAPPPRLRLIPLDSARNATAFGRRGQISQDNIIPPQESSLCQSHQKRRCLSTEEKKWRYIVSFGEKKTDCQTIRGGGGGGGGLQNGSRVWEATAQLHTLSGVNLNSPVVNDILIVHDGGNVSDREHEINVIPGTGWRSDVSQSGSGEATPLPLTHRWTTLH